MKDMHDHRLLQFDPLQIKFDPLQSMLVESMREGILLISDTLEPTYLNRKAKELNRRLWNGRSSFTPLPPILSNISRRLFQEGSSTDEPFILDYPVNEELTIRIRACLLTDRRMPGVHGEPCDRSYVLVFLEDRNDRLAEDLKIEKQQYDLTERETEVLRLLRHAYSYQNIAETLHISLNTVKFHVKNIHSKKRCGLDLAV
ncbi:LuxR C-terminal-related transcriptional regulator [Alkalinema pantanalense CENA528]|uniref:helix-turn-helix transcriptional regulator n=1 Tax=Alkalinema pantanalense TaxID=1620705 RepID=UPI003D6E9E63